VKRTKINQQTWERAVNILEASTALQSEMRSVVEKALRDGGADPDSVPECEMVGLMIHGVAVSLKKEDELTAEFIDEGQIERMLEEEAIRHRDPKTGLIDQDEILDAVTLRQQQMLHNHAPQRYPAPEAPRKKKAKKNRKRMMNRRSGAKMKMVVDLTIEDLELMRGPECLGEEADTLIDAIRLCNPDVPEKKLRKMTLGEAFASEATDEGGKSPQQGRGLTTSPHHDL
jgi:hypothetical protein